MVLQLPVYVYERDGHDNMLFLYASPFNRYPLPTYGKPLISADRGASP